MLQIKCFSPARPDLSSGLRKCCRAPDGVGTMPDGGGMANHQATFRNGVLSIYQSAIEDLAHRVAGRQLTPGNRPGMENEIIAAGVAAAASRMPNTTARRFVDCCAILFCVFATT